MRSCMGERSWTSSTTMWPKERMSSSVPEAGARRRHGRGGQALGPEAGLLGAPLVGAAGAGPVRTGAPAAGPEDGAGLVDERGVGHRPGHLVERARCGGGRGAGSPRRSGCPARPQPAGAGAQQVVQELVGGEAGPHAVERLGHLRGPAQAPGQVGLLFLGRLGVVVAAMSAARSASARRSRRRPAPARQPLEPGSRAR